MKKFIRKICIVSSVLIIAISCFLCVCCELQKYGVDELFYRVMSVENRATNLKVLEKIDTESTPEYDVLIITDVHFGNENKGKNGPRRESEWFNQLTEIQPNGKRLVDSVKFAICMGDVADHGKKEEFLRFDNDIRKSLEAITTDVSPSGIKIYNIIGNHDLYNNGWSEWSSIMYPHTSFYKFETSKYSWYFIDSASGTVGGYQFNALSSSLKNDDKPKFMFSHVPIYAEDTLYFTMQNTQERNLLIAQCARNNVEFFIDGHTHKNRTSDFGKFTERNIPGFLEKYSYAIMHVNEITQAVSIEIKKY